MFEGLGGSPAPGTEGREIAIEPGGVGGQVALSRPHLMNAPCEELGEPHKGVGGKGGREGVPCRRGGHGEPVAEEDGPRFFFHRGI